VIAFVVVVGAGVYLYAHKDEGALQESRQRGGVLVQALETYREEHGSYPERLDTMVPEFIAGVEPPTWGLRRWRYRAYAPHASPMTDADDTERTYFQLSVARDESGYPVLYYDFATRRWVLNN
jgi:hypothetical protein